MEFCEKNTLRDYIDAGLCHDISRVWQLFREIVEGLVHIHEQVNFYMFSILHRHSTHPDIVFAKELVQSALS